jgi:hypothetical protein
MSSFGEIQNEKKKKKNGNEERRRRFRGPKLERNLEFPSEEGNEGAEGNTNFKKEKKNKHKCVCGLIARGSENRK